LEFNDVASHDAYAAMRVPHFRLLLIGRLIATIGEQMVSVAVGWDVYEKTGDAFLLGMIGLVHVIPVFLFALPAGVAADRYSRRTIAIFAQAVLIVCALVLTLLSLSHAPLIFTFITLVVIGTARAFNTPAENALTPLLVPESIFHSAATWSSMVWQLSAITGPALGGVLIGLPAIIERLVPTNPLLIGLPASIARIAPTSGGLANALSVFGGGATTVYSLYALGGVVLFAVLLIIRPRPQPAYIKGESPIESVRAGLRFLRRDKIILPSITLDMFAVLLGGAVYLLPVYAKDILQVGAEGLGWLRAAPAIGALCMSIVIANRPPFKNTGRTLLLAVAGFGLATIVFGVSTNFWLSMAMMFALGALDNISVIIRRTIELVFAPDAMRGRISAVQSIFIGASNELGGFESGVTAALLGAVGSVVFGGFGTLIVVGAVAVFAPQLRMLKRITRVETEPA